MPTLNTFSGHLAKLIPATGSADFPAMLVDMLRNLVPVDDASIIVYPNTDLPMVEYFEVHEDSGKSTLDVFVKGAFLLDPYYLAATASQQFGVFRLRELSPGASKTASTTRPGTEIAVTRMSVALLFLRQAKASSILRWAKPQRAPALANASAPCLPMSTPLLRRSANSTGSNQMK